MSDRRGQRVAHPRTGASTGVIEELRPMSGAVRPPLRSDPPPAASPLQPGALVAGRYRIERLIGIGGMGAVYEATQVSIQRRVALKVLRSDFADDPAMVARFQREARAASAVHHENVVVVHDFGQDADGTLFMVMELLSGESLLQKMRREGALPPREAVRIACEVLAALEAAHAAGVVHRDLKPDNVILLDGWNWISGKLKVLDFGIARILDRGSEGPRPVDAGLTGVGQLLGTPRYMSPEAVARLPVGPAGDLYALGAILFEMLTGRPVFQEREPVILMGHHLRTPPPRLREVLPPNKFIPPALDDLVNALLAKIPTERPESAAKVRQVLLGLDWNPPPPPELVAPLIAPLPAELAPAPVPVTEREKGSAFRSALRFSPLVLIAVGIAGLLYLHRMRLEERRAQQATSTVQVLPSHQAPVGPRVEWVRMTILGAPENATFRWDGESMPGSTFDVPADGRSHRLEVSASGYQARTIYVIADGPHELRVQLERERRWPAKETGGRREPGSDPE
jgi:serine/threonine-protein kinase